MRNSDKPSRPAQSLTNENGMAALFILPFILLFGVFLLLPSVMSLFIGFFDYDLFAGKIEFVGLHNYFNILNDELFHKSVLNTIYYNLFVIPATVVFSLMLALVINQKVPGIGLFRGVYFLPAIVALVASGFAWKWLLGVEGWINYYLQNFGIQPHPWLNDQKTALNTVIVVAIWQSLAVKMIIFLAGLKSIPIEFYESAKIDGANAFQCFRRITLPLLRDTTFFIVVITVIDELKVFAKAFILTRGAGADAQYDILGGAPNYSTLTVVGYIYGVGFRFLEFGYGAAMSLVMLIVILAFTAFQFRFYNRHDT